MLRVLKMYRLCLTTVIYVLPFVAFEIGWRVWIYLLNMIGRSAAYPRGGHSSLILVSVLVWAFMASRYKVTSIDELFRERTGARAAWSATLGTAVILIGVLFFGRNDILPRGLFISSIAVLLSLTLLVHAAFRFLFRRRLKLGRPTRLLIVGADQFAHHAAARLQNVSLVPCEVVGYVRLPGQQVAGGGDVRICDLEELRRLHPGNGVDEVVLAVHPAQFSQIPTIIEALGTLCVPARAVVDLGEGIVIREKLFQMGRMQMLDLTATPADSPDYALLKRAFDFCFALAVLLITFPLMIVIAILIRLTSEGPILFAQERVGLNGLPFKMYKFRTMKVNPASESDTRWTTELDPRRTRLGSFMRKTSLDELPQFFNVLKGDMSVVGPRPERPHFVQQFLEQVDQYNHRHCLRVGITGWAQVNGWRGDTSIEKRIEYDLYYLQNWTFGFDLRIILMTLSSVFVGRNAY
jgi:Undecaprenyl-phosphate glucose phosphotransferase